MEADKKLNKKTNTNANNINLEDDEEFVITDTMETGINKIELPDELMAVDITNKQENNNNIKLTNQKIKPEQRKVMVPANRMKPLKDNWTTIVKALVVYKIFIN
jgi:hypothetical protein